MSARESQSPPRCQQAEHSFFDSQAGPGIRTYGATNLDFEAPLSLWELAALKPPNLPLISPTHGEDLLQPHGQVNPL